MKKMMSKFILFPLLFLQCTTSTTAKGLGIFNNNREEEPEEDPSQLFQVLTLAIQSNLAENAPSFLPDVADVIKETMAERCTEEEDEEDCKGLIATLISLQSNYFSQLGSLSELIGLSSIRQFITMFVEGNFTSQLQSGIVSLEMVLSMIEKFSGDAPILLQSLLDLTSYAQQVSATASNINGMAPNLADRTMMIGILSVAIATIRTWFLPEGDDDDGEERYLRGLADKNPSALPQNTEFKAEDVNNIIQNAIFGFVSSRGNVDVSVLYATLSYSKIYGGLEDEDVIH